MLLLHITEDLPPAQVVRGPTPGTFSGWKVVEKETATGTGLRPVRQPARRYVKHPTLGE